VAIRPDPAQETARLRPARFRIATKVLRYRTELLYDVGHRQLKAQLRWLADLQDAIGVWHDRQVLDQAVAEAVARADYSPERAANRACPVGGTGNGPSPRVPRRRKNISSGNRASGT
jgi:CHAD domain-containing protein